MKKETKIGVMLTSVLVIGVVFSGCSCTFGGNDYVAPDDVVVEDYSTTNNTTTNSSNNDANTSQSGTYSDKQLCDMSQNYYEKKTGYRPPIAEVDSTNGDTVTIHLYENKDGHTATSAWYDIDRNTGKGKDTISGEEVDLTK